MLQSGMPMLDILAAQREVYEWAFSKGWEPDPDRPFADACALMHSEVSEALEAYRMWKFDDATEEAAPRDEEGALIYGNPQKPEGVASELVDVFIRLAHYCAAYGFSINQSYPMPMFSRPITFGIECSLMHASISGAYVAYEAPDWFEPRPANWTEIYLSRLYALIRYSCKIHDFDLEFEYKRKMIYNHTRAFRHGNRVM